MTRIKILAGKLDKEEIEDLNELAEQAGYDRDEIDVEQAIGEPDEKCEDEVFLVAMTPALCGDETLDAQLAKLPNGGRRAIAIWPADQHAEDVPTGLRKYGYSIIPWDAQKLKRVLGDDDELCFEDSDGEELPRVETERNECT